MIATTRRIATKIAKTFLVIIQVQHLLWILKPKGMTKSGSVLSLVYLLVQFLFISFLSFYYSYISRKKRFYLFILIYYFGDCPYKTNLQTEPKTKVKDVRKFCAAQTRPRRKGQCLLVNVLVNVTTTAKRKLMVNTNSSNSNHKRMTIAINQLMIPQVLVHHTLRWNHIH